jgi:hypothetical protein
MSELLGSALGHSPYGATMDVIAAIDRSPDGNTVLRTGHAQADGTHQQTGHIVLTPEERDQLIARLTAHRAPDPASPDNPDDVSEFDQAHRETGPALDRLTAWQRAHPGTADYRLTEAIDGLTTARRALQQLRDRTHAPRWHTAMGRLRERLADEDNNSSAGEMDAGDSRAVRQLAERAGLVPPRRTT